MPTPRHYSFDLWMTLIRSNPQFKIERAKHFHTHYNSTGKTLDEVTRIFRQVDVMCNSINECTGGNIDAEEMYLMVINLINDGRVNLMDIDMVTLYRETEGIFYRYLPVVFSVDTIPVLEALRSQPGTSLNILSNTAFVKGKTLREALCKIQLEDYFDFQMYSDEESMSKPNRSFFCKALERISQLNEEITVADIIHIGDNPVADVKGAANAGINSLLINSNETSILQLLSYDTVLLPA